MKCLLCDNEAKVRIMISMPKDEQTKSVAVDLCNYHSYLMIKTINNFLIDGHLSKF